MKSTSATDTLTFERRDFRCAASGWASFAQRIALTELRVIGLRRSVPVPTVTVYSLWRKDAVKSEIGVILKGPALPGETETWMSCACATVANGAPWV